MFNTDETDVLHVSQVKVRYYDTDLSTAVFFANYIKWFDSIAIIDFLRERGVVWSELLEENIDVVVASVTFDYKSPIFLDDVIDITIEDVQVGNKSIRFSGSIYKHNTKEVVCIGSLVYVVVEYDSRNAIPVPDKMREKIEKK